MEKLSIARGARRAEECLIQGVLAELSKQRSSIAHGLQPVLVVVPSAELRHHVAAALARAGATLGVEVTTLHAFALDCLGRAGASTGSNGALFEVLARRAAKEEPQLQSSLADLEDGYGLAAAGIRDLLSAGLDSGYQAGSAIERAALRCRQSMDQRGCRRSGDLHRSAAEQLPNSLADRIWIHGFADAPGQTSELLRALIARGAHLVLDLPDDPAEDGAEDRGGRFARSFAARLGLTIPDSRGPAPDPPQLRDFSAADVHDEAREVALRIRRLLMAGVDPDAITVVMAGSNADPAPFATAFEEWGIPFRGPKSAAASSPVHRRLRAALRLAQRRDEASIDDWLDALPDRSSTEDLRIAFRTMGLVRLKEVANLELEQFLGDRNRLILPLRQGRAASESDDDGMLPFLTEERNRRRSVSRAFLIRASADASALIQGLRQWPQLASLADHADALRRLLDGGVNWVANDQTPAEENWRFLLERLRDLDPDSTDYRRDEFLLLAEGFAKSFGATQRGGRSGVRLLDQTAARALTAEHLFVVGLHRHALPSAVREDPLLPDQQRLRLREALPDLLLRSGRADEERYLFAQLLSMAPSVELSFPRYDAEGKAQGPSNFLFRLWLREQRNKVHEVVPRLREELFGWQSESDQGQARPVLAREAVQWAGLRRLRNAWQDLVAVQQQEVAVADTQNTASERATILARARRQILDEYEPDRRTEVGAEINGLAGPYLGCTLPGEQSARLFVTRLERQAVCPWQSFLRSDLGLEGLDDPSVSFPGLDQRIIGTTVHKAMELLVTCQGELPPRPSSAQIAAANESAAKHVAADEGVFLPALIQALNQISLSLVERLVALEWGDKGLYASGSEVRFCGSEESGSVSLPLGEDRSFTLHFRADRVDVGEGGLIYTDYKTGNPISNAIGAETRRKHFLSAMSDGKHLQGVAYSQAKGASVGRYLFALDLDPENAERAMFAAEAGDLEAIDIFHQVAGKLVVSLEQGIHFPRLESKNKKENKACTYCDFVDACLRHDSGARDRLRSIGTQPESIWGEIWRLGQ